MHEELSPEPSRLRLLADEALSKIIDLTTARESFVVAGPEHGESNLRWLAKFALTGADVKSPDEEVTQTINEGASESLFIGIYNHSNDESGLDLSIDITNKEDAPGEEAPFYSCRDITLSFNSLSELLSGSVSAADISYDTFTDENAERSPEERLADRIEALIDPHASSMRLLEEIFRRSDDLAAQSEMGLRQLTDHEVGEFILKLRQVES